MFMRMAQLGKYSLNTRLWATKTWITKDEITTILIFQQTIFITGCVATTE